MYELSCKTKRKGRQEFLFQTQIQINKLIDQLIKLKMTMKPINKDVINKNLNNTEAN